MTLTFSLELDELIRRCRDSGIFQETETNCLSLTYGLVDLCFWPYNARSLPPEEHILVRLEEYEGWRGDYLDLTLLGPRRFRAGQRVRRPFLGARGKEVSAEELMALLRPEDLAEVYQECLPRAMRVLLAS